MEKLEQAGAPSAPDFAKYELEDVGVCTLKNARGDDDLRGEDGQPVTVEVYSPGSAQGRKADHKFNRPQQLRMFRMARGEVVSTDQADAERELKQRRIDITKSFSANFPWTPEQVYGNPKAYYIGQQIDAYYAKAGNFEKGSSPS